MVEKSVLLCDSCERSIAMHKCSMCSGDMCQSCAKVITMNRGISGQSSDIFVNTFGIFKINNMTSSNKDSTTICKKCIVELKSMFKDLSKIKREDEKIFVKDLLAFIKYRLPQILTASQI
jgi:hypothetical protein